MVICKIMVFCRTVVICKNNSHLQDNGNLEENSLLQKYDSFAGVVNLNLYNVYPVILLPLNSGIM